MQSHLFDLGNSNDGPIGMVLRVRAANPADAVRLARQALRQVTGDCGELVVRVPEEIAETVEYIHVYVNPAHVSESDISETEDL